MMKTLKNKILISMPSMTDPLFKKSIVYLFEHDINGAAGVIINKGYSSLIFNSSFKQENFQEPYLKKEVLFGGPVQTETGIVLHDTLNENTAPKQLTKTLFFSENRDILRRVNAAKNIQYRIIFGHSAWDSGQLENELKNGDWIAKSINNAFIFNKKLENMWIQALNSISNKLSPGGFS